MTALMWQTALLLLGAYFLGAWVACMARRFLFAPAEEDVVVGQAVVPAAVVTAVPPPPPAAPPRPVVVAPAGPKPAPPVVAPREASSDAVARFERALSGGGAAPPRPAPAPAPAPRPDVAAPAVAGGGKVLPVPPDRSSSGVSTMVEAIRSRAPEVSTAAGSALAAAAAAVSRASPPPPGSPAQSVLPAVAGTSGRGSVSAPVSTPAGPPDDLTRIQGIDAAIQTRLNSAGVRRFAEIAAWKPDQVAAIAAALGMPGRIERENWIEQAQILAKGGETLFSSRRERGEVATARPMADEGASRTPVAAAAQSEAAMAAQALRPAGTARDNLQRIGTINGEVERLLNVQGVQRYSQIATWTPDDIAKFDRLLGSGGRIARENWIEQAQVLDRGGQTAYSREIDRRSGDGARPTKLASAIAGRTGAAALPAQPGTAEITTARALNSALRSVKSEAYRAADAPVGGGARSFDDLKRIRGVGVLIEKKLNSLGITSYEQVASWTQDDIERYSDMLDFKGRIERENWVQQARVLSSGGQTEFSRRVDRGEVETSKKVD